MTAPAGKPLSSPVHPVRSRVVRVVAGLALLAGLLAVGGALQRESQRQARVAGALAFVRAVEEERRALGMPSAALQQASGVFGGAELCAGGERLTLGGHSGPFLRLHGVPRRAAYELDRALEAEASLASHWPVSGRVQWRAGLTDIVLEP